MLAGLVKTSQIEKKTEVCSKPPYKKPATPLVLPSYTDYRHDIDVRFGGVAEMGAAQQRRRVA